MLGEGRRWWITSSSDSHVHWREGGSDFWPGEYSKTYVLAARSHHDVLEGLRTGRVFVTTGDLISELEVTVEPVGGPERATLGETLTVDRGADVRVTIRVRDPAAPNHHGDAPAVARVDVIAGAVTGRAADPSQDTHAGTRVARRFTAADWSREGEWATMTLVLPAVDQDLYVRVRGTSTDQLEPEPDPPGEDPWSDLWFYSNPVFVHLR
jgi:hypothetical protein